MEGWGELAGDAVERAVKALSTFGEEADLLRALAEYVLERQF